MDINSNIQPTTPTVDWNTPPEEPPGPDATPAEVAQYLYEQVEAGGLLVDGESWRPIATWEARRYCDANGHRWQQVAPLLRELRAQDITQAIGEPVLERSPAGLVINRSLLDALHDIGWLPKCPGFLTGWSRTTFSHFTKGGPCGKWWCEKCGVKRLDLLLSQVWKAIEGLDAVFIAEVEYDSKLVDRVRSRHGQTAGSEYFWFRRDDGRLFYLANIPLGGGRSNYAPAEWTRKTPQEALEWLQTVVMVLPGYHDHSWSNGWKPAP